MNSTHVGESSRPARYRGSVRGLTQALSCLALLFSLAVSAAPVSIEQARLAVSQFVQAAPTPLGANLAAATRGGTVGEALAIGATRSASAYAYVVALQPEGYVVVSADDRLEPIIAFSASGTFDASMQNPLAYLLAQDLPNRLAAVAAAATRGAELATQIAANQADWAKLTAAEGTRAAGAQVVTEMWVDSFVQSRWSQGTEGGRACYNYYTPLIGETSHTFDPGNPDNIVSGCAATATAQMIRYFAWPEAGIGYKTGGGSVTYHDEFANPEGASLAGTQLRGGNGNGGPYDWAAMTLDPNGTESEHSLQQVGALCFDAGLALNMKYNIERSNMSGTNFSSGAFTGKFNYSGAGSAGGISGMRANLDARRPVAITIGMTNPLLPPPGGGHAIVGDGYGRIDGRWYYHFNMGWGGGGDLWYNVEEYYYDSVAGGTEWAGLGASVGNVYRKALQVNEDAASGKIISGRVTDAAGNPVPGVAVKLTDGGGDFLDMLVWNENGRNTTDENGIWAVDKVPAGDYDIVMTKDGLAFAGPKEVTVGAGNQWGLNFIATDDTGPGELVLENWYYDYDNFVAGAALVILEFNRPVGNVAVDPTSLTLHSGAGSLTLTDGVVFQSAGSPLVVILLDPVDAAVIVPWGGVSLTLDMARDFLTVDVDGEGSQGGEDEANVIPVAPLVTGLAENPGFPINPAQPLVASTKLLVDGAVLGAGANPYATKESPVQFLVTFSQPVMGVDADDFSLRLTKDFVNISTWPFEELAAKRDTPLPSAAITSVDATDATGTPATSPSQFWTVTVNMGTGDGFVRLDVIDNDTITHDDGTRALVPLGGPGVNNGDFFYSEFAYRYDNLGPVIVAATLAADNTYVDITWNEPVGSTNSLAKTSNFSDIVSQYAWGDTNGTAGHDANDALWLDRSGTMDNTFRKREDVVLMEPPFTAGLADGQARTGQFKYIQASGIPFLGTATIARVCYVELDGVAGCSEGDGLFLDVGEAGFGIVFDDTFTPGQDLWFWPSGTEPAGITAGTLVPDRTSYYAENGAIPVPDYADALDEYVAWILDFYASANNGIWLDYGPADQTYTIGNINDGFVDTLVMGVAPTDGDAGTALPADAMYRDTNQNGLVDDTDLTWLDTGAMADALDGGDTRLDDNGEALPGALFTHSLQVILRKNGGTVTSVGISRILNGDGTPMTDASNVTRAMLKFTPEQDLGGTAPGQLNEHRIPAGIETIAIVPIADNVFDALGNAADTQTSTGEMRLHDSGVPRIIDVILADDNYSAKVVFSERVYTNGNGISNHSVASVPDRVGNLTAGDFTVTTNTGAVTVTSFSNSLATNYCILTFGGTAAGRQLVDPAANLARTTLTVSVSANAIYDFAGNAVPATVWPVALRRRYNIDNPDTLPPRCFTNGDNAYRKEPTGPTPAESSTVTDAAGLTYHGIYYRDLDGDCRVDTVDLNFRNPRPNSAQSPNLSVGAASASSKFRVWVQNNDPEDTSNAAADENLANVPDTNFTGTLPWPASADWTNVTVTGASVLSTSTYYSTIRVTINQTQVRPRTHGRRWIMISYNDPDDRMDGIPPTTSANTTYEADGVHWLYVTPTPSGGTDPADWYWILGDFPPTMAWDAAPARPVAATMWRTTNYNKSGEASSYNSYDYMDVVFSEPLSSVGDGGWMPGASYGSGTNVHEKEGPFGPEILDLLSGTAQTVRIWFDSTSVTSRTFGGGSASSYAQVVDAAGYRNPTPRFTGTTLGVR
ncbi:MAG: hypothetical protein HN904_22190, partial [Victivallales bacterium]|nr:hypothetical protein [Victivallales bacterium]